MTQCFKLLSFCLVFTMLSSINTYAQVFKKIHAEGGDLDKDCIKAVNNIYNIDIGVSINMNNNSAFRKTNEVVTSAPCDLHVGIHVKNINTTFYQPVESLNFNAGNPDLGFDGVMSISFDGDDYELPCQDRVITVVVDLYCKNGDEYTPIDVCRDRSTFSSILPLDEIDGCSVARTLSFRFCCGNGGGSETKFREGIKHKKLKSTKLRIERSGDIIAVRGFDKKEEIIVDIFTISGQKVANTQFYFESDNTVIIKNTNLAFGYYIVRVVREEEIQTIKFINF